MIKSKSKKPTDAQHIQLYKKAIEGSGGNVSEIARKLNMDRVTFYKLMNNHEEIKKAVEEAREVLLDDAESLLYNGMKENPTLLMFFLKTQGKKRGYVERVEQSVDMTAKHSIDDLEKEIGKIVGK